MCQRPKKLKFKPKTTKKQPGKKPMWWKWVKYLQMQYRAPQAASWWRSGPRCRLCGQHTPWPAGTPLGTWSLWNWTQSDADSRVTLTQKEITDTHWTWQGSYTFHCSSFCQVGMKTDLLWFWWFVPAFNDFLISNWQPFFPFLIEAFWGLFKY